MSPLAPSVPWTEVRHARLVASERRVLDILACHDPAAALRAAQAKRARKAERMRFRDRLTFAVVVSPESAAWLAEELPP